MEPAVRPIAERWNRVTGHLAEVARAVDPERWGEPSPYRGWACKDLLAHLATGYSVRLAQLHSLVQSGKLAPGPDADAANEENIARHRGSSPEALIEEMLRQRSEVQRLLGMLRPEHLQVRASMRGLGEASFLEALQHYHEHDLEHAADLAPVMRWPVAPPET